jgi:uncharacterized membrane protein YkvA (DUF1232 family)
MQYKNNSDIHDTLEAKIIEALKKLPGRKAKIIAIEIGVDRKTINKTLYGSLKNKCHHDENYCWYLNEDVPSSRKPEKQSTYSTNTTSGTHQDKPIENSEKLEQDKNIKFLSQLNRQLDTWLNSSEGENHEHRELLAQVPNIFSLLCKLADNNVVSEKSKSKLAIAKTYFVKEFDLMPEVIIGPVGYQDDLVISALAIRFVMDYDSKDIVRDSWEGNEDIIALIADIINNAVDYVGQEIYRQLVRRIG